MKRADTRSPILPLLLVVAVMGGLAACLKEEGQLTILPDGSGRLDLEVTFGGPLSDGIREDVAKGQELVEACRAKIAGSWKGIGFWTDEVAEDKTGTDASHIHYRGSAWFAHAGKVSLSHDPWKWEKRTSDPPGFQLDFSFDPLPQLNQGQSRSEQFEQWRELLEGFDVVLRLRLPGHVTVVSGRAHTEGRVATYHLTRADLQDGSHMSETERTRKYHRLLLHASPPTGEAMVEQEAFQRAWDAMKHVGVPHEEVTASPPQEPAPPPLPLDPPLTLAEADRFYSVPTTDPDWDLERTSTDALSEWWTGSLRGSRHERIPVIIRIPLEGRPCPVAVKQHTWHGTKESGQATGLPVLKQHVAVVSFDGPLVGSRAIEGKDPLGESPEVAVDNHQWAVSDLRAVIRALSQAPLPPKTVSLHNGVVVVGVSLGGPTAMTAFALEKDAAAGITVVAGAGAWSAARDGELPGTSLEGAGDMRLRKTPASQRTAALLDPAMILPLVPPRPIAIIGGAEDGFAPATSLQRLARAAQDWPEVTLRVYPAVGHFITESQAQEVSDWIAGQAHLLP